VAVEYTTPQQVLPWRHCGLWVRSSWRRYLPKGLQPVDKPTLEHIPLNREWACGQAHAGEGPRGGVRCNAKPYSLVQRDQG